ncbi:MSMEG_0570 family nitrogen starvation response protein [Dactylosporangium sp. McL0621]|uniref:MSMEG_0570 family nitrogen starvation response protein n=1 Tax=Dactylosporangium sp. McL0621 TaxID=3415678 RepID=UPI003CF0A83F
MPERFVVVRWPDARTQRCYSPSTVVEDYFRVGDTYTVADFVERSREALSAAGERVRAAYGFPCGKAARQIVEIERWAAALGPAPAGRVTVERIDT